MPIRWESASDQVKHPSYCTPWPDPSVQQLRSAKHGGEAQAPDLPSSK